MRRFCFLLLTAIVILTACNRLKSPRDAELKTAIDAYLQARGKTCTWIGQPFPVDVSESQENTQFGIASKMATFEHAGLVYATNTVATVPQILGANIQRRVKRYNPTSMGSQYVQVDQTPLRQSAGFCYGTKEVDSIVNWTDPAVKPTQQTNVTYTYKIANLAPWAQRSDIQNEFNDIRATIAEASKTHQTIRLELTNEGWQVPQH